MTRILKRGQKTYFKEDVVACLADETMQKTFTQSEYGNRIVFMEELQEEAKERFNMDFTDEDYKSFKTLIAKDEYLLSLDDNAGILESKALDIVVGYGRVKGGVSGLWEKEQAEYDQKEQLYADLLKKHPMKYDAKAECLWLPDGTKVNNVLSPLQAEYYHDNYLYHEVFERMAQMEFENSLKNEVLDQSNEYKNKTLSKLQCNCQYFLGNGNCLEKHLWANNLDNHILAMKMIYESFDEQDKPVWINKEMIDLYKDQMWTASLSKQANSLCDRLMECFEDMDPYEAMDCRDIDIDTQKHAVYEALVTGDTREFEEDTQNSFSYAEVKAIASGNPIIKEKFEVDNEVKRLETMRRSWQKKKLQAQDDVALLPDRIETEKKYRTILAEECEYFKNEIEANNLRDTEHFTFYDVKGNEYHDLKEAWDAIQECTKGYKLSDYKENKFVGRFMKADVLIGLGLAGEGIVIKMKTPLRTINVDSVNPVGRVNFNRMYKRINDMRYSLNKTIETIQNYEGNLKIAKEMVNKPFELQDELTSARNRQKEINKILDTSGNENSKVVVEDDLEEERNESCMEL